MHVWGDVSMSEAETFWAIFESTLGAPRGRFASDWTYIIKGERMSS